MLILIVIDYVSVILSEIYNEKISSSIEYKYIIKKLALYLFNEIFSILENLKSLNLPIPDVFKDFKKQMK